MGPSQLGEQLDLLLQCVFDIERSQIVVSFLSFDKVLQELERFLQSALFADKG